MNNQNWKKIFKEHLALLVTQYVRHKKLEHSHLAEFVYVQVCRPGLLGYQFEVESKHKLILDFQKFAKILYYDRSMTGVMQFVSLCTKSISGELPKDVTRDAYQRKKSIKQQIKEQIVMGTKRGLTEEELVRQTAKRIYRRSGDLRLQKRISRLGGNEQLREVLCVPEECYSHIPKTDIRSHMLTFLGKKNSLLAKIETALPFSEKILRPALGDELYEQLNIVGYADTFKRYILCEPASPSLLHELNFQKPKIMQKLRSIEAFRQVRGLKFQGRKN